MVFSATVNNLTEDMTNNIEGGKIINGAIVEQGKTEILGSSNVNGLSILKKDDGNLINGSTIFGGNIDQGNTNIKNGGEVLNTNITSDSKISNGTIRKSHISQGKTEVAGGVLSNTKIESTNNINNVETYTLWYFSSIQFPLNNGATNTNTGLLELILINHIIINLSLNLIQRVKPFNIGL